MVVELVRILHGCIDVVGILQLKVIYLPRALSWFVRLDIKRVCSMLLHPKAAQHSCADDRHVTPEFKIVTCPTFRIAST